jgi:hypothetical protein
MIEISDLIQLSDRWRAAAGLERESTLSHRIFGDTKILGRLRAGGEITVGRFNLALAWFDQHWPEGAEVPSLLQRYRESRPDRPPPAPASGDGKKDAA